MIWIIEIQSIMTSPGKNPIKETASQVKDIIKCIQINIILSIFWDLNKIIVSIHHEKKQCIISKAL